MNCDGWRTAYSARLDGEDPGAGSRILDAHERSCAGCRAWAREADALHRSARVAALAPVPDFAAPILAALGPELVASRKAHQPDDGRDLILRVVLAVLACAQILSALPALFGDDAGVPIHTAHHLGSLDLAIGVGFLAAAWRPRSISGLLPVGMALVACTILTSTIDVLSGNAATGGELQHVVGISALAIAWILSRHRASVRQPQTQPRPVVASR
ncbi:MAG: conserved rane protein of unknown function [Actinomycetia bacterium]|nr:conserved rane protein of unknown function [Actinomycetes bacterium]